MLTFVALNMHVMILRRTLMLSAICCCCLQLFAQQTHFIFIQSENQEPFAAIVTGKVYSASEAGHVIIPKLVNGNYIVRVEFPMNKYPAQTFTCDVKNTDVGYALKKDNNAWTLKNIISQDVSQTIAPAQGFSDMLSDVTNTKKDSVASASQPQQTVTTPAVIQPPVGAAQPPAETETTAAAPQPQDTTTVTVVPYSNERKDSVTGNELVLKENIPDANTLPATSVNDNATQPSTSSNAATVTDSATKNSNTYTYLDKDKNSIDTVKIYIPERKEEPSAPTASAAQPTETVKNDAANETDELKDNSSSEPKNPYFSNSSSSKETVSTYTKGSKENNTTVTTPPVNTMPVSAAPVSASAEASNTTPSVAKSTSDACNNAATENDIAKARRKMFVTVSDEEMVKTAEKYIGKKCLLTEQVRALGSLLMSDSGRYKLYIAMYPNVTDKANFKDLRNMLFDASYKKMFDAAIR